MVGIEQRMVARLALVSVQFVRAARAVSIVPLVGVPLFCLAVAAQAQVLPRTGAAGQAQPTQTAADNDDLEDQSGGVAGLPGYPGRGLALQAVVTSRYEDNLSRRLVRDDGIRIRPKATATYGLGAGRFGLYAVGSYGRDIVRGNRLFEGANRHYYGAGVTADLSRCTIDGGGSYRRNLVFMSDVVAFGGIEQETTQYGATANCRIGSALSLSAGASRADLSVLRRVTAAIDSSRWTYTAGVAFARPAFGRVSLDGSWSDIDLTGRQVLTPTGPVNDGLRQRSIRLGLQRDFGSRISLTLGGSYLDTQPTTASNVVIVDGLPQIVDRTSFKGAGYDAGLVFRLTPRLSFNSQVSRNIRTNGFVGAQFMVVDLIQVGASYELSNGFDFSAGYAYRDTRFRGGVVTSLETVLRTQDEFSRYFARFGGKLGRRLNFAFDVSHNQRRSNPSVYDFTSTGVGMTLGFELGKQRS